MVQPILVALCCMGRQVSRMKAAAPLNQRINIFVRLNGLAHAVEDRLGTLTEAQCEAQIP